MNSDSGIHCLTTISDSKESCRKGCSREKIALVDTRSGGTCEGVNYHHAHITNSKSSVEIRYVNSAIYMEPIDEEEGRDAVNSNTRCEKDHQRQDGFATLVNCGDSETSVIDLPDVPLRSSTRDGTNEQALTGRDTYRCYSTIPPHTTLSVEPFTSRSVALSETIARVQRRCRIDGVLESVCQNGATKRERYILDNRQVVRISTTSLSDRCVSDCQTSSDFARRIAHSEWVRRKHETAQRKREDEERAAKKRQEQEEKMARKKEERARFERDNFLEWMKRKRRQELDRRVIFQNELELQKHLKEMEDKAAVAKALYLRQWICKKKEEQKARYEEQESTQRKMNQEREKRLEQCSKAYERWRQNSKNRPKPATQGLLPHQKAKPAYINPIPWQPIIEIDSDETQEGAFSD